MTATSVTPSAVTTHRARAGSAGSSLCARSRSATSAGTVTAGGPPELPVTCAASFAALLATSSAVLPAAAFSALSPACVSAFSARWAASFPSLTAASSGLSAVFSFAAFSAAAACVCWGVCVRGAS